MLAHIHHTQVHAHTWWGTVFARERKRERCGCYHYGPEKVVSTFPRSQSCLWDPTLSAIFQRLLGTSMCPSRTSYSFANYPYHSSIPNSILHQWLCYSKAFPHVSSCCAASSHVLLGEFHRSLSYVGIYFQVAEGVITVSLLSLPHSCCPLLAKLHYLTPGKVHWPQTCENQLPPITGSSK